MDSRTYEFSSMLKFIETIFDLPAMTERDRRAHDMLEAFDFRQEPLDPLILEQRDCPAYGRDRMSQPQRTTEAAHPSEAVTAA